MEDRPDDYRSIMADIFLKLESYRYIMVEGGCKCDVGELSRSISSYFTAKGIPVIKYTTDSVSMNSAVLDFWKQAQDQGYDSGPKVLLERGPLSAYIFGGVAQWRFLDFVDIVRSMKGFGIVMKENTREELTSRYPEVCEELILEQTLFTQLLDKHGLPHIRIGASLGSRVVCKNLNGFNV